MALNLSKRDNYVNPYHTNWHYLYGLTELQMKRLEEMEWNGVYIYTQLWDFPWAWPNEENAKSSMKGFINDLNEKIMEL